MRNAVSIVLLFASVQGAAAAPTCADLDTTQTGLNECYDQTYQEADRELNTVYRLLAKRLTDEADRAKRLVAAQKAWIDFRDAECKFNASGVLGGSAYPMVVSQCFESVTRKRIDDLKGYLDCQEGDLSCPAPAAE